MPIDLSALPAEVACGDDGPSAVIWLVLFIVVMGAGAGLTLWCWPAGKSVHEGVFWAWLFGVPGLCYGVMFSLRYGLFQYAQMKTHIRNEVRDEGLRVAIRHAQQPLSLLEIAYVTALGGDRVAERIVDGESVLESTYVDAVNAHVRHSILTESEDEAGPVASEFARKPAAIRSESVYQVLLERMTDALRDLPARLHLDVYLVADGRSIDPAEALVGWKRIWVEMGLRGENVEHTTADYGVMEVDRWLDNGGKTARAILVVAAQLYDVPPSDSTEAGVALLFVTQCAGRRAGWVGNTALHRPVEGTLSDMGGVLASAMQWGRGSADEAGSLWQSGVDSATGAAILAAWTNAGRNAGEIQEVDASLGHAGIAADWLGIALASEHAHQTGRPQMVASQQRDLVRMTMIK